MIYWVILILALIHLLSELFPIIVIEGNSMYPTLLSGEIYLGVRVFRKKKIRPLQVYVFRPPYDSDEQRYVVKRLFNIRRHPNGDVQYFFDYNEVSPPRYAAAYSIVYGVYYYQERSLDIGTYSISKQCAVINDKTEIVINVKTKMI